MGYFLLPAAGSRPIGAGPGQMERTFVGATVRRTADVRGPVIHYLRWLTSVQRERAFRFCETGYIS